MAKRPVYQKRRVNGKKSSPVGGKSSKRNQKDKKLHESFRKRESNAKNRSKISTSRKLEEKLPNTSLSGRAKKQMSLVKVMKQQKVLPSQVKEIYEKKRLEHTKKKGDSQDILRIIGTEDSNETETTSKPEEKKKKARSLKTKEGRDKQSLRLRSKAETISEKSEAIKPNEQTSDILKSDSNIIEWASVSDPYLMDERQAEETNNSTKWTNKQRTLCFATRGGTCAVRFLLKDLLDMLPHSISEVKFDKKLKFDTINEIAELNNCNNVILIESRKQDAYLWMARSPLGPSVKLQVFCVHTMNGLNYIGNCLKYSRPFLIFDKNFKELPHLRLLREMFVQIWGTPRHHPRSKPFHDHAFAFFYHDDRVWFRHYQIFSDKFDNIIEHQHLREIGPRFCLQPIRIFKNSFGGPTLWKNEAYDSPTKQRSIQKRLLREKLAAAEMKR